MLIDVRGDDLQETSTFGAIRDRAAALMRKCVIGPPHLGGTSFLGEVDGLVVQVFGALREGGGMVYCFFSPGTWLTSFEVTAQI